MDPNWFYSTLAQSTAAIVGLAGGFLAARLLAQRAEVAETRQPLRIRFAALMEAIGNEWSRTYQVYEGASRALGQIQQWGRAEPFATLSHDAYAVTDPSPADVEALQEFRNVVLAYQGELGALMNDELAESRFPRLIRYAGPGGPLTHWLERGDVNPFAAMSIEPKNFWEGLRVQRDWADYQLNRYAVEAGGLQIDTWMLEARSVPGSFYAVLAILASLTAAGVIAPMFFLSATGGSSKPILLGFFVPLAISFVVYLALEVFRIRRAADLSRETFSRPF